MKCITFTGVLLASTAARGVVLPLACPGINGCLRRCPYVCTLHGTPSCHGHLSCLQLSTTDERKWLIGVYQYVQGTRCVGTVGGRAGCPVTYAGHIRMEGRRQHASETCSTDIANRIENTKRKTSPCQSTWEERPSNQPNIEHT